MASGSPSWDTVRALTAWWWRHGNGATVIVEVGSDSVWTLVEVRAKMGAADLRMHYAILNETGALYRTDSLGAVADDPIEVEALP